MRSALVAEWERGTAFNVIPVFLAAGSLAYFALPTEPGFRPLVLGFALLALLWFGLRGRLVPQLLVAALLCASLGAFFAKVETWRAGTQIIGAEVSTRLTARVALIEHMANGRVRMTLDVLGTERPVLRYAPSRVRVSARAVPEGLAAGTVIAGVARLMPPSGPVRPGGFDFAFETYFDGIGANGFFLGNPEIAASAEDDDAAGSAMAWIENARSRLAARIKGHIAGEAEGEIAAALVAGVRAGIPEDVNEALRKTGLAHVLSISGLHMALVSLTIMGTIRFVAALFPALASRRAVKKYAASAALVALAVYLFISGSAVAAERSFIMIAVMLAALLVDRSALTMRNLAIAAIVILAVSPHEAAGPSFQMSFAATAALIGAYAAWSSRRAATTAAASVPRSGVRGVVARGARYFAGLAATSLVAGAATAIYGVYHFQRLATLGLASNLAAMPVVSLVVMPFAVFGMVFMPLDLDGPFFAIMGEGIGWMIAIAEWFAERSPVDAVGMIPQSSVLVLTAALLAATLFTTWLRLTALPLVLVGLLLAAARPMPDVLIAEDARLLALVLDGSLAVNRSRPNGFTIDNWRMATNRETVERPVTTDVQHDPEDLSPGTAFICGGDLCMARHGTGAIVAHAASAEAAWPICGVATLIVIDDATASSGTCETGSAAIITKRDLALRGSAAVTFATGAAPHIAFSVDETYRPWHSQRAFSREARGLPPRRPPANVPAASAQ
ncbi:MAG: ComEC/Rec2 family competence protein [Rhizobiaceae bacterium]|nr:ComEC/Rec2 family competence protein [Rhizobiaceae bacterium]